MVLISANKRESYNTTTISTGNTSIIINHKLGKIPSFISISPTVDIGGIYFWVSDISATVFTLNISSQSMEDMSFLWSANA